MTFLLQATRESRGRKKWRHWLILATRVAVIVSLALAVARPLMGGLLGWGRGSVETVVLVLDRSASMEAVLQESGVTRRVAALQRVQAALRHLDATRLVLVDSATAEPQLVASPDALGEMLSTQATDVPADMSMLLQRATDYLLAQGGGQAELWVASDMQQQAWNPASDQWAALRARLAALPLSPQLRILDVGGVVADNLSLQLLGVQRRASTVELELELRWQGAGEAPRQCPVTMEHQGGRSTEQVTLQNGMCRWMKILPVTPELMSGMGRLELPADGNERDNVVFFSYAAPAVQRAVLVSAGATGMSGEVDDYLAAAAAPQGVAGRELWRWKPSELVARQAELVNVATVLWSAPLPEPAVADVLLAWAGRGGQLLVFPHEGVGAESFAGVKWLPQERAANGKYFLLEQWQRGDGLLRDGARGASLAGQRLRAIRRSLPQGEVIEMATWQDGGAFLARQVVGKGMLWFFATLPDSRWSNLGDAFLLLPAVQRALDAGGKARERGQIGELGLAQSQQLKSEGWQRESSADGSSVGKNIAAEPWLRAGVFRRGDDLIARNLASDERESERIGEPEWQEMLRGLKVRVLDARPQAQSGGEHEMWQIFLVALLALLLVEAVLCLPRQSASPGKGSREWGQPQVVNLINGTRK